MATTATMDLHFKVKSKALRFWEAVIMKYLKKQGMIDGNFPEIIFSKEHKKIIQLNRDEIKRRLNIVLGELNANGCLEVLIQALLHDPHIEVVETAVEITKFFLNLLKKYHMTAIPEVEMVNKGFFELVHQDLYQILEKRRALLKRSDTFEMAMNHILEDIKSVDH